MLPVIFKDSSVEDLQKAYNYLEEQETGLGEKLLEKITEYVEVIETNPYIFRSGYKQVRQVRIKPFQYLLRYKTYDRFVAIIQLFHSKQHPKRKVNK
jgi:plasmid stabilization system protein ParE